MISTQVSPELSPFAVEANAQKLVTLLAVLGFSIDSVAERRGNKLLVTFIGAANCWGLRSLSQGNPLARPPLVNDFGAKVVGCVKIKIPRSLLSEASRCHFDDDFHIGRSPRARRRRQRLVAPPPPPAPAYVAAEERVARGLAKVYDRAVQYLHTRSEVPPFVAATVTSVWERVWSEVRGR